MATMSERQRGLLAEWLGAWETIEDHSWPLQDTIVLRVRNVDGDHIVKASETSHHIAREINAHVAVLDTITMPVPRLEFSDIEAGVLVTSFLPGDLVLGSESEWDPDVYRQAGAILKLIQQPGEMSSSYVSDMTTRIDGRIDAAAGLVASTHLDSLRRRLHAFQSQPIRLHFTHGDYQPRNWLHHRGQVSVIDFGRGAQRSWVSDLVRLQNRQFLSRPELEHAFLQGLTRTLTERDAELLELEAINESLGTVLWAHGIGDGAFEEHGRTIIARIVDQDSQRR